MNLRTSTFLISQKVLKNLDHWRNFENVKTTMRKKLRIILKGLEPQKILIMKLMNI